MKVREASTKGVVEGTRIVVTGVAPSIPESRGHINDKERLMGQIGTVERLAPTQIGMKWDSDKPGSLMLASEDEIEVIPE